MSDPSIDDRKQLRVVVYCLLIVCAVGNVVGRIWRVQRGDTVMLSANDRSRWCTVRSLVEHGTYQIDDVIIGSNGYRDRQWYTIDLVRHRGRDGREHFYSSKPTLLPTLLAAKYWLLRRVAGVSFADKPLYVGRALLITTNVIPLVVFFVLLTLLIEQLGRTDWGRMFVMAAATWGTFLTTFAVTLNNHLPAAISTLVALYAVFRIVRTQQHQYRWFALAGLAAAFAVANELPALSFAVLLTAGLFWLAPRETCLALLPSAGLIAAGLFGTNYLAHQSWRTPYAHRQDGAVLDRFAFTPALALPSNQLDTRLHQALSAGGVAVSPDSVVVPMEKHSQWSLWDAHSQRRLALVLTDDALEVRQWQPAYTPRQQGRVLLTLEVQQAETLPTSELSPQLHDQLAESNVRLSHAAQLFPTDSGDRWVIWDGESSQRFAIVRAADQLEVRAWDNWYEYEGTYWAPGVKQGVDLGETSRAVYAFHSLIGHRGIFSLTPIWVLSLMGMAIWIVRGDSGLRAFAAMTLTVLIVCVAFYLMRGREDRNYGGVACGFRWMFWCIPLWLLTLQGAADAISRSPWMRAIAWFLLLVSVASASYANLNPWTHSWLYEYWSDLGWIHY